MQCLVTASRLCLQAYGHHTSVARSIVYWLLSSALIAGRLLFTDADLWQRANDVIEWE